MSILTKLDELKRLADVATPGKWQATSSLPVYAVSTQGEWGVWDVVTATGREYARHAHHDKHGSRQADAEFIAASRTALPQLVEIAKLAAGLKCKCTGDDYDCQSCFLRERIAELLEVRP